MAMNFASPRQPRIFFFNSETVEQRRDEIKDLLNKGLVTDKEATKARKLVLIEL
ncbi:hypothetical protein [Sideroxydans sp. CL21]|uniref:hypothetical protein n=1 Tax=Sideroxydans sp. CL21 TaxID=2600596 RepID=UPI0024BD303B|nr:hypothetical protein [Sideroxydans sp. CL21]